MLPQDENGEYGFEDFTESGYRRLIKVARSNYAFESFARRKEGPAVLWRHDIDASVHRALALARIERDVEVRSTFFFWLHSPFYSLFERTVAKKGREILEMGHRLGLHFDPTHYDDTSNGNGLDERVSFEAKQLKELLGQYPEAMSFHHPEHADPDCLHRDEIAGIPNAYGRSIMDQYEYVSDSNGYWRFQDFFEVCERAEHQRLHVLTHPEWWTPEAMSPRDRISRCIEGRAKALHGFYDKTLKDMKRQNVR